MKIFKLFLVSIDIDDIDTDRSTFSNLFQIFILNKTKSYSLKIIKK